MIEVDQDHAQRAVIAGVVRLDSKRRVSGIAGRGSEWTFGVFGWRFVTEHDDDLSFDIDAFVVVVAVVFGADAVAGKYQLGLGRTGRGKTKRRPILVSRQSDVTAQGQSAWLFHYDADRHIESLEKATVIAARL